MRRLLCLLFVLPLLPIDSKASTVAKLNNQDITRMAHDVVLGKVVSSKCRELRNGIIVTTFEIRVEEDLKCDGGSPLRRKTLRVTIPGGKIGDRRLRIPGMPGFYKDEEVVLFVNRPGRFGTCVPIGLGQGKFRVHRDPKTKKRYVSRALGDLRLVDPVTGKPVSNPPSEKAVPLEPFLRSVRKVVREGR